MYAPLRDDTPCYTYCDPMPSITNAGRDTQLYLHTLASAIACASQSAVPVLDVPSDREASPAAQRVRVLRHLDETLTSLDAVIGSKKVPPLAIPVATLGRYLVERGENYDAVARTYTPGPGFSGFIDGLLADAMTKEINEAAKAGKIGG